MTLQIHKEDFTQNLFTGETLPRSATSTIFLRGRARIPSTCNFLVLGLRSAVTECWLSRGGTVAAEGMGFRPRWTGPDVYNGKGCRFRHRRKVLLAGAWDFSNDSWVSLVLLCSNDRLLKDGGRHYDTPKKETNRSVPGFSRYLCMFLACGSSVLLALLLKHLPVI